MSLLQNLVLSFSPSSAARRQDSTRAAENTVRPAYRSHETEDAYHVAVQMPGVAKDGLEIASENGVLTIVGRRAWKRPEGWTSLYRESTDLAYSLALECDASVDMDKVNAEMRDGVLRISLPKSEAAKPRRIAVA